MKKNALLLIWLILISTPSYADTRASILLLHNGQGTSFEADQLQDAVYQAVIGDTICLSEGTYQAPQDTLVINKPISIIGTGADNCKIVGNVKVAIDGEIKLVPRLLDAINVTEKVIVSKTIKGVKLRKCWVGNFFWVNEDIEAYDIEIDRCYLCRFVLKSSIKSALLTNSVLGWQGYNVDVKKDKLFVEGCNITFFNCNIYTFDIYCNVAATYENCIIYACNMSLANVIKNNTFINTLFSKSASGALTRENEVKENNTVQNCYWDNFSASVNTNKDDYPTFKITSEALQERGLLGTDGTIVGADGGSTPYTLEADGIHIKESVLKVDPVTRQLNVTLKVE